MSFLFKKNIESILDSSNNSSLAKTLNVFDLILIGLGSIIGTGVFVFTGFIAARYSGPAVMVSYAIAGCVCILVAMTYSELATMLPSSGSLYSYCYLVFGEIFACMIAGILFIELAFGASAVAGGWAAYIKGILESGGIWLPKHLITVPSEGGVINLLAAGIVVFSGLFLCLGTKDSKRLNAILVLIKFITVTVFIVAAAPHFKIENWQNFMPFGFDKVVVGGSILFLAFTGFTNIAASAEECKNPEKDILIGIVGSVIIAMIVYISMAGLVTGIVLFSELDNAQPLAQALRINGEVISSTIVASGAVCGMSAVLLLQIYGISRIFYVIARDGLLPKCFTKLSNKHKSPNNMIIAVTLIIALLAGFCPYQIVAGMSSMGALADYVIASLIVMILRVQLPNAYRPFKCPLVFVISGAACLFSFYLLLKQMFSEDYTLSIPGKGIIACLGLIFIFYIIRAFFIKNKI